ncbi:MULTISPECIES: hypothetical protein [unclassified Agarivorans]|nr:MULTISPECIES: hypothetical protein [unclassified Agarivorans]MDO6686996.1 hypothetical protein [Agarivorans sp. 3_MG-2023]MDO6713592.1 hypothetical protein [Agarivorans sp. 2_MG-2023]
MYAQVEKPKENKSRVVASSVAQKKNDVKQAFGFVDNRSDAVTQRRLQKTISDSQRIMQLMAIRESVNNNSQTKSQTELLHDNSEVRTIEQTTGEGSSLNRNELIQMYPLGNLGTQSVKNTEDTSQPRIIEEILKKTRGTLELINLQDHVRDDTPHDSQEEWILQIALEFNRMQQGHVRELKRTKGNIYMSANVLFENRILATFGPTVAGKQDNPKDNDYTLQDKVDDLNELSGDQHQMYVSRNDADGKVLTDVVREIPKMENEIVGGGELNINLHDGTGPCDGCKTRIEKATNDVATIVGAMPLTAPVDLYSHTFYPSKSLLALRKYGPNTSLGWAEDTKNGIMSDSYYHAIGPYLIDVPLSAEEQEAEDRYQAFAEELGPYRS